MLLPDKRLVFKYLLVANILLILFYWLTSQSGWIHSGTLQRFFDLDGEANVPTWFSSAQLLMIFLLSGWYAIQLEDRALRQFYWLCAFVFLFFSMDETVTIHENITYVLARASIYSFFPDARGMWILIYPIIALFLALFFWRGMLSFFREKTARSLLIAGAMIFVLGGVGMEIMGYFLSAEFSTQSQLYVLEVAMEEFLEYLGQSMMIYAMLIKLEAVWHL